MMRLHGLEKLANTGQALNDLQQVLLSLALLIREVQRLQKRIEELEAKLRQGSSKSGPPDNLE